MLAAKRVVLLVCIQGILASHLTQAVSPVLVFPSSPDRHISLAFSDGCIQADDVQAIKQKQLLIGGKP